MKKDFRIMTFNIRRGAWFWGWEKNGRKDKIVAIIKKYDVDIFCLQESLHFQYNDIRLSLNDFDSYFSGRSNGGTRGEACPIFYNKDRYELLDSGTFWLSSKPESPGTGFGWFLPPRICSWVKLQDGDEVLHIYNTHFSVFSKGAREKSAQLVDSRLKEPFVLVGDFNASTTSSELASLRKYNHTHMHQKQIDHIFSTKIIKKYTLDVNDPYPSDHYALIGELGNI